MRSQLGACSADGTAGPSPIAGSSRPSPIAGLAWLTFLFHSFSAGMSLRALKLHSSFAAILWRLLPTSPSFGSLAGKGLTTWLLLSLLAGCTSMTPKDTAKPEIAPQEEEPQLDNWRMQGKLSIRHEGKSRNVSLDWQQTDDQSRIILRGPLGGQQAAIKADSTGIVVDLGDGPVRYPLDASTPSNDKDLKMTNTFQVNLIHDLPWNNLRYWVLGLTGPEGQPLPSSFNTGQWQVATLRLNHEGCPELMTFTHPSLTLRLKIKSLDLI